MIADKVVSKVAAVPVGVDDAVGVPTVALAGRHVVDSGDKRQSKPQSSQTSAGVGQKASQARQHWYVAVVNNRTERSTAERLNALGYETYVAAQDEVRVWRNGRRHRTHRIAIPAMIFIRCTEARRLEAVRLPYIFRFLSNRAAEASDDGRRRIATVPEREMATLRFMLGQSEVPVEIGERTYVAGQRVRVTRGRLQGLEGETLTDSDGRMELYVQLDILGCARLTISPTDLEPLA